MLLRRLPQSNLFIFFFSHWMWMLDYDGFLSYEAKKEIYTNIYIYIKKKKEMEREKQREKKKVR